MISNKSKKSSLCMLKEKRKEKWKLNVNVLLS